jgi:hypothetical protein
MGTLVDQGGHSVCPCALYAHAPAEALSRIVALRVHLDDSTAERLVKEGKAYVCDHTAEESAGHSGPSEEFAQAFEHSQPYTPG